MTEAQSSSSLQDLQDIRRIMERSSRFISLSGLSGIAAGICALAGCWIANMWIHDFFAEWQVGKITLDELPALRNRLLSLALVVLFLALALSYLFTLRKMRNDRVSLFDLPSRRLIWNMLVPLVAGGLFILALLQQNAWQFVAPASLVFYGLALVNASKYTVSDIRYLGYLEILLGLINTQVLHSGLYFWGAGFGILHIVYGCLMWWKYERNTPETARQS